ncbi:MAG: hypothetical protein IPL65_16800 [Lewinellaceae bacterium]|nr:hypothetical protein [Lewinellaceae bacterium]
MSIPGRTDTLQIETTLVSDDGNTPFSLSGKILSVSGYLSLIAYGGSYAGFIQAENEFYEILPGGTGYQYLIKKPHTTKGCGNEEIEGSPGAGPGDCEIPPGFSFDNDCPSIISVLLVVQPAVRSWIEAHYGSMEIFSLLGAVSVNLAFYNSDIPNKEVRVEWVEEEINLAENQDIDEDLATVTSAVNALLSSLGGDVAIVVTNEGYSDASGAANVGPDSNTPIAIVEAPYFLSDYVFAHEFGHLIGGATTGLKIGVMMTLKCAGMPVGK